MPSLAKTAAALSRMLRRLSSKSAALVRAMSRILHLQSLPTFYSAESMSSMCSSSVVNIDHAFVGRCKSGYRASPPVPFSRFKE
ncbi:hypothetical protein ACN6KF_006641 [Labrys sp. La1]|uniref:hypothetical protein n=1 Tax=Labrys sp. La1 TaxID=3404917 RepID=UPI003EBD4008